MTEHNTCCRCGQTITGTPVMVGNDSLCECCAEEEITLCSRCGERIYRDDNAGDEDTPLCQHCYENHYYRCDRCGRVIHEGDSYYASDDEDQNYPLCHACYSSRNRDRAIQDYYYKPEPLFRGDGPRYFGVELEIDGAGEDDSSAREVMEIANSNGLENLYCKHDGSLDDGFEMVTHPMTLDYHRKEMPWKKILHCAVDMGYTSHQAGTCGLHVHVNRDAFGDTEKVQDAVIGAVKIYAQIYMQAPAE